MHPHRFLPLFALCFASATAQNSIVVTYAESPGRYTSTLQNTIVENFDATPTGWYSDFSSAIGVYDELRINPVDQYGGAGLPSGSNYVVQGVNGPEATNLSLQENVGYFGLWWSAGDDQNVLEFYNDSTLVARFTTSTLLDAITQAGGYHGNPATGANSGEPYAFVNFFGEGDTSWNRIRFTNTSGSGFESDNHTIRDLTWGKYAGEEDQPLPGVLVARVSGTEVTVIPEPTSAMLGCIGAMAFLRRRRKI